MLFLTNKTLLYYTARLPYVCFVSIQQILARLSRQFYHLNASFYDLLVYLGK